VGKGHGEGKHRLGSGTKAHLPTSNRDLEIHTKCQKPAVNRAAVVAEDAHDLGKRDVGLGGIPAMSRLRDMPRSKGGS
jgi:hypothetical protein